jgi:hypothetical protein
MSTRLSKRAKGLRREAGIALVTTLLLMFLMSSLLVGFTVLLISNQQLAGSNNDDVTAFYGAEAGMEQLTASLGNLFSQTYSPSISQIDALETTPPVIPGISYLTGSGASGYQIVPMTINSTTGNPQPNFSTILAGPYMGMTAMIEDYTLTVNARTTAGREVKLQRTTETVGIPMFQFAVFCEVDCAFHAGQNFTLGGRVHGNSNLFLASGSGVTLTMQGKVDAYKDIIRTNMDNGASVSANWPGTVSITTNPGGSSYRSLALTEGSLEGGEGCTSCADTKWPTISTGSSPTDYGSNLINGLGSEYPQYSTGADLLNLAIVTLGSGTTQPIDLIRRPVGGESSTITGERYFAQASLAILLSDNPSDIMSLPCVDQSTQPFDLSQLAQPVANWNTSTSTPTGLLLNKMATYGTTPLPLAASGSLAAYNSGTGNPTAGMTANTDGYWLPANSPIIKGYLKIQAQTAYGAPCGTWKDVTAEILALGYAGRNINPVPQSLNGTSLNPAWPSVGTTNCASTTSCNQMDLLSNGTTTHYYYTTLYNQAAPYPPNQLELPSASTAALFSSPINGYTYTYPLPIPAAAEIVSQSAAAFTAEGTFTGQSNTCVDPHPNAVIRLERIRDNPSSLYAAHYKNTSNKWVNYVASGALATTNEPQEAPIAVVCGVDPVTKTLPVIADSNGNTAAWTPQPWDFWNNTLFDTREGTLRDNTPAAPYSSLPTLNGTMHYVELDIGNLVKWFAGTIGTSGTSTKDPVNSPNDFSVYFSDRRGNYTATQTWTGTWPPLSPSTHETGEYGWSDFANSTTDPTNGCPNNTLDPGEDLDSLGQQMLYSVSTTDVNYIMGYSSTGTTLPLTTLYNIPSSPTGYQLAPVITTGTNTGVSPIPYGEFGYYTVASLTAATTGALKANPNCTAPTYTNGVWPMQYAAASNAARENPPIFFRRALKLIDAKNLTALGTCPSGTTCGLAVSAENPVYMQGDYNANSAGNGFSDPSVGASVAADAVTILSNNWNDVNSFSYNLYAIGAPRNPSVTYYRAAVIGGKGVSFPDFGASTDNGTDGGVHNFLRYLENWGNGPLAVNYLGALVNLYTNRQANGIFKCCTTVYSVPNRVYSFDTNFLTPGTLPPRTPLFRDVDTTGWTRLQLASQ